MKFSVPLCIALALPGLVSAAEPATWLGAANCRIDSLKPEPKRAQVRWSGKCTGGYAEGPGVLRWATADNKDIKIEATLAQGQVVGEGKLITEDGTYTGTLRDGLPHGAGYFEYANGDQYEGGFANGKREGRGEFLAASGAAYTGHWKEGKRHGLGSGTFDTGGSYKGEWKEDKIDGNGVMTFAGSGRSYDGRFEAGRVAGTAPRESVLAKRHSLKAAYSSPMRPFFVVKETAIPPTARWSELTFDEQNYLKGAYPALEEGDEPPYPLDGPAELYRAVGAINSRVGATGGPLTLLVLVGTDGKAKSVRAVSLLDKELVKAVATVAGLQRYKPAVCRGQPCEMNYAIAFKLELE